jgi:chromate transporter
VKKSSRLLEVLALFLKLGLIGFGGPAATIGMMEEETVHKRKWVSQEYFLEMLAATNLVPGPNATEMAGHLGYLRAGLPGLLAGGIGFLIPGSVISLIMAVIYVRYGSLPQVKGIFQGINPVVAAILVCAFIRLGKSTFTDYKTGLIAAGSLAAALLGVNEIPIMLAGGALAMLVYSKPAADFLPLLLPFFSSFSVKNVLLEEAKGRLLQIFLFFLKVGALLFGSTYVLIAFMQREIVNSLHWLTYQQMLDAVVAGQVSPGPISTSATFAGYVIAGYPGAALATLGIFTPSFLIVILTGKYLPRINKIPLVQYFLKGVIASAVALIAYVTISVIKTSIVDVWTAVLAISAVILIIRCKVDAFWMILAGVVFGLARIYIL